MKTKNQFPCVSVIIVNYNGIKYLPACLASLSSIAYPRTRLEIILVDNGSTDKSPEYVRANFPQVKILQNDVNNYARANNLGARKARGKYIALLNNDTKVNKQWLRELVTTMESDTKAAAAGSKILFFDGRVESAGHRKLDNFYWEDKTESQEDREAGVELRSAVSLCGCSVIYRKSALRRAGYFDEDFNMYLEDVDISIRLKRRGWHLLYVSKSIVYHVHHGTSREEEALFFSERNRLLLIAKHYPQALNRALWGRGYFTAHRDIKQQAAVYQILAELVLKIIKHHRPELARRVLSGLFEELKNVSNAENRLLVEKICQLVNSAAAQQGILAEQSHTITQLNLAVEEARRKLEEKERSLGEKEIHIAKQAERLQAKEGLLAEKEQRLSSQTADLKNLEQELENKNILLLRQADAQKQSILLAQESQRKLEAQEIIIYRQAQGIAEKERLIQETDRQLQEQAAQIQQKDEQLLLEEQQIAIQRAALEGLTQERNGLRKGLEDKTRLIQEKERLLAEEKKRLELSRQKLAEQDALLAERERAIQVEIALIEKLDLAIKDKDAAISKNEHFIQEQSFLLQGLNAEIEKRNILLKEKERLIREQAVSLQQGNQQLAEMRQAAEVRDEVIRQLHLEVNRRDTEIKNIYESTAFRYIVRPLWTILWSIKQCTWKKVWRSLDSRRPEYVKLQENDGAKDCGNTTGADHIEQRIKSDYKARLFCYYLPQFHPIQENDVWWGKGFTEWRNVAKARPLFRGHYQPHVPSDLGFYDLRLPETRFAQAELAREYGIEGFCYWHYWFGGKRILDRLFNEVLRSKQPDFPFCLGWANESWTGIWHGAPDRILIGQIYNGKKDEEAHFYTLLEAFFDERYITIEGKPLFYVYRPHEIPEPKRFIEHWQELAIRSGLKGIYFIGEDHTMQWNPKQDGFDASVPHSPGLIFYKLQTSHKKPLHLMKKMKYYCSGINIKKPKIFFYEDYIEKATQGLSKEFLQYPSILPNWDNTPRCGPNGFVLVNSSPELFRVYLQKVIAQLSNRPNDKRIIFVKSWNEWAEGSHLEPDLKFGRGYLEACRNEVC